MEDQPPHTFVSKWLAIAYFVTLTVVAVVVNVAEYYLARTDETRFNAAMIATTATVVLFCSLCAPLYLKFWEMDASAKALTEKIRKHQPIVELKGHEEYFESLLGRMKHHCRHFCWLMFFSDKIIDPDPATSRYWKTYIAWVVAADRPIKHRRIATVGSWAKLRFLLEVNKRMLDAAKGPGAARSIDYQLAFYPFPDLKPPQIDLVDDTVFLFAPYLEDSLEGLSKNKVMTSEEHTVRNLHTFYEDLWSMLIGHKLVLLDLAGGLRGYDEAQVRNWLYLVKLVGIDRSDFNIDEIYNQYFNNYCNCDAGEFARRYEATDIDAYLRGLRWVLTS